MRSLSIKGGSAFGANQERNQAQHRPQEGNAVVPVKPNRQQPSAQTSRYFTRRNYISTPTTQTNENVISPMRNDDDIKVMVYCLLSGNALPQCLDEVAELGRRHGYREGVLRSGIHKRTGGTPVGNSGTVRSIIQDDPHITGAFLNFGGDWDVFHLYFTKPSHEGFVLDTVCGTNPTWVYDQAKHNARGRYKVTYYA